MNRTVAKDELLGFVGERKNWILTTMKQSGGVQLSPVTGTVDSDGLLLISTYPERAKTHNIRLDPTVSICVLSDEFGGAWVQVDGNAHVNDLPEAMDGLVEYYRSAAGEHPDWDEYRRAMKRQGKCLIQIEITGWGPIATGGFPSSKKAMFEKWQPGSELADDSPQMFDD
ncbi:MAG: PPOX class F420-dependent oxidoreductase [Acidimicrobiales bacterium]|nr:PPOX class F420-dependent oxidoreductase [Acidimicrobiales bacterium]